VTTFFWTWCRLSLFIQSHVRGIYVVGTLSSNMKNENYSHLHRIHNLHLQSNSVTYSLKIIVKTRRFEMSNKRGFITCGFLYIDSIKEIMKSVCLFVCERFCHTKTPIIGSRFLRWPLNLDYIDLTIIVFTVFAVFTEQHWTDSHP